jgi:hypothetical protein
MPGSARTIVSGIAASLPPDFRSEVHGTVLPRSTDISSPQKTALNGRNCQMCRKITSRNIGVNADGKLLCSDESGNHPVLCG